jgi:hypothetical protein
MKKISYLMSVVAIAFAVASSFAFSSAPHPPQLATFINTTVNPNVCEDVLADCPGGDTPCTEYVEAVDDEVAIWAKEPTGCMFRLTED